MPISLQEYRAKQQQIVTPAIRLTHILGPVREKILSLQEKGSEADIEKAKQAKAIMDAVYTGNAYMIVTPETTTEETFNEHAKKLDRLPELLDLNTTLRFRKKLTTEDITRAP